MEKGDRKRSREDRHDETSSPPSYGSQGYWEERYKRLQIHASKDGNENKGDEEPEAFHAWYFSYEELSPLILSLIVGDIPADDTVATIVEPQEKKIFLSKGKPLEDTKDTYAHSHAQKELEAVSESADENDSQVDVQEGDEEGSVVEDEEWSEDEGIILVEDEGDDDDDEGPPQRVGLAKDGPIDILEVGCGDVPLGQDIISSIRELYRSEKRKDAGKILKSVTCIDYSSTVIEAMKAKQTSQTSGEPLIPLEFTCADARKLPYQDERFHFVLEKGTMDAMLSDSDMGSDNCRSIVAEMARVVTVGGMILP